MNWSGGCSDLDVVRYGNQAWPMSPYISQRDIFSDPRHATLRAPPMGMACLWSRMRILREVWHVVKAVGDWRGVTIGTDRTGLSFMVGGATLGHLRWNGRLVLQLGTEVGDRLVAEAMASRDPDQPDKSHVVFDVRSVADVDRAVWLLRIAYLSMDGKAGASATDIAHPRGIHG